MTRTSSALLPAAGCQTNGPKRLDLAGLDLDLNRNIRGGPNNVPLRCFPAARLGSLCGQDLDGYQRDVVAIAAAIADSDVDMVRLSGQRL